MNPAFFPGPGPTPPGFEKTARPDMSGKSSCPPEHIVWCFWGSSLSPSLVTGGRTPIKPPCAPRRPLSPSPRPARPPRRLRRRRRTVRSEGLWWWWWMRAGEGTTEHLPPFVAKGSFRLIRFALPPNAGRPVVPTPSRLSSNLHALVPSLIPLRVLGPGRERNPHAPCGRCFAPPPLWETGAAVWVGVRVWGLVSGPTEPLIPPLFFAVAPDFLTLPGLRLPPTGLRPPYRSAPPLSRRSAPRPDGGSVHGHSRRLPPPTAALPFPIFLPFPHRNRGGVP